MEENVFASGVADKESEVLFVLEEFELASEEASRSWLLRTANEVCLAAGRVKSRVLTRTTPWPLVAPTLLAATSPTPLPGAVAAFLEVSLAVVSHIGHLQPLAVVH